MTHCCAVASFEGNVSGLAGDTLVVLLIRGIYMSGTAANRQTNRTNPNTVLETFSAAKNSFELYDAEIEAFFLENYIYHDVIHRKDRFASLNSFGKGAIVYLHRGRFKQYITNPAGQEVFLGFLPQHSTLATMKSGYELGKSMIANTDCSIYVATNDSYFKFLQSSPRLIEHQLFEPYYRRNLNDFAKIETMFYPAQVKVYEYVSYLALLFGKHDPTDCRVMLVDYPPTVKDMANYLGIHRSNASRYLSELEALGLVEHSSKLLKVNDIVALDGKVEELKRTYLEK